MIRFLRLPILVLPLLLAACSAGSTTRTETVTDESTSTSSSISLHGRSSAAGLERGKQLVIEGKFTQAVGEFQQVYRDPDAKRAERAEALFELGEAYSNVLNPWRDDAKALEYYRKLLVEFPDSPFEAEARENISRLEGS